MPLMTGADRSPDDRPTADLDPVDTVVQLSFAVQELLGEIAAEHDLSITQLRLLGILRDREPAMLDLARHLKLEKSSVTGLIDRAQRRGLVERVPAAHDARAIHVRLTAEGRRVTEHGTAQAYETLSGLLDALPARDRARLSTLAGTVVRQHTARRGIDLGTQRTGRGRPAPFANSPR
jgi:MarR family transcriptional regulator, lower aerobic nicotinate degradation pathway regulator